MLKATIAVLLGVSATTFAEMVLQFLINAAMHSSREEKWCVLRKLERGEGLPR